MGKQRKAAVAKYDKDTFYSPADAIDLVKSLAYAKFDEGVDATFFLGIDARKADQLVRSTVSLPHGTGKTVRVAVFAESDKAREAEAAGADVVGGKDLADAISAGGALDFDVAIATPDMMSVVGKLGPVLGPRGLMPNPKSGTVTVDVAKAVEQFKAGRVEFRNDRYGNVHVPVGRVSFDSEQLRENYAAAAGEILRNRPAASKGRFMKKAGLSSTMGPGIRIDPGQIEDLVKDLQ